MSSSEKLYRIQDADRPMYVIADSWMTARAKWKQVVAVERVVLEEAVAEPAGIQLLCESERLIT